MRIATFDGTTHVTPILRQWGDGFTELGHEWDFYDVANSTLSSCGEGYDIIVTVGGIDPHEFESFKNKNPKTKLIHTCDNWYPHFANFKGLLAALVTNQHSCPPYALKCKEGGIPLIYTPLAADKKTFYREKREKLYDINFIGSYEHGYRGENEYLIPLLDKYKCFVGGRGPRNSVGFVTYQSVNEIRNSSKLTLNFHVDYQKEKGVRVDLNQTAYSSCLSDSLQICDHPLTTRLFYDNVPYITPDNLLETVAYFLENESEREGRISISNEIVLKKHTWKQRMSEFLSYVERLSN